MPRRMSGLRPINSLKHIVDSNGTVSAGTVSTNDVIVGDSNPDYEVSPAKCKNGSTVHSIYLRVEVIGSVAAGGVDNIYMAVVKNPGANLNFPALNTLGTSDNRKYVIHQEMTMLTPFEATGTTGFPRTLFKGVIRIPKGYKRVGIDDRLSVLLQHRTGEATQTTRFCLQCIYKEYN